MTDDQIEHMVQRFLTWKLPENFHPDAGIKFEPVVNLGTEHQYRHEPVGTNLFDYTQAEQMVRHMLDGLPDRTDKIAARMGARFEDRHGTRKSEALADDLARAIYEEHARFLNDKDAHDWSELPGAIKATWLNEAHKRLAPVLRYISPAALSTLTPSPAVDLLREAREAWKSILASMKRYGMESTAIETVDDYFDAALAGEKNDAR